MSFVADLKASSVKCSSSELSMWYWFTSSLIVCYNSSDGFGSFSMPMSDPLLAYGVFMIPLLVQGPYCIGLGLGTLYLKQTIFLFTQLKNASL